MYTCLGGDLDGGVLGDELGGDGHALHDLDARLGDGVVLFFFCVFGLIELVCGWMRCVHDMASTDPAVDAYTHIHTDAIVWTPTYPPSCRTWR